MLLEEFVHQLLDVIDLVNRSVGIL